MALLKCFTNWQSIAIFSVILVLFNCISVTTSISCFECSSVNDTHCPEFMTTEDESVVPYISCDYVHQAYHCIKQTGVAAGARGIKCYKCDETKDADFGCTDALFSAELDDCSSVFDAQYCIKTIGSWAGSLGTRRFCSSRDMGNYCEYIKRPGDQLEYRSCVFTCSSDGCNPGVKISPSNTLAIQAFLSATIIIFYPLFT